MTKIDKLLENIIHEIENSRTKKIIIKPINEELINYIDKQQNLHVLVKITSKNKCLHCYRNSEYINKNNDYLCWIHALI